MLQPRNETRVSLVMQQLRVSEQVIAEYRCHSQSNDERCRKRDDVDKRERREHAAFETAQTEEWQEDQNNNQRSKQDRISDLTRRFENYANHWFRVRRMIVLLQPPENVFDVNNRVVDESSDRNSQTSQGHCVDRDSEIAHYQDGGDE